MAVLSKHDLERLIKQEPPLLEGWIDLDTQLQANGFDLTLREVALLRTAGKIAVANSQRAVSDLSPLVFDGLGFIDLVPGTYIITFNEIVHLPRNLMALGRPRSSLLRCGVTVGTAVWDAGYSGRSQALMVVYNPGGFRLQNEAHRLNGIIGQLDGNEAGAHLAQRS